MRAILAVGIGLLMAGPALAAPSPEATEMGQPIMIAQARARPSATPEAQRANVPRTAGTGLSGVPMGVATATILGMSPGVAAVVGLLAVGGIVAIAASDDDDTCTPSGTGTGTGASGC